MNRKLIAAGLLGLAVFAGSVATGLNLPKSPPAQIQGQASTQALAQASNLEPTDPQILNPAQEQSVIAAKADEKTFEKAPSLVQPSGGATNKESAPALAKPETQTPTTPSSRSQGTLKVTGSASFSDSVNKALALLNEKAPNHARKVTAYLKEIRESDHSGVMVQTGVFNLGRNTVTGQDTYWLASVIVHDAYHVELYQKGQEYAGKEAEARCIEVQKDALLEMGAPEYYQTHLNQILQSNFWEVPFEQRNW